MKELDMREIAANVFLVGGTAVNWVIVRDGDSLTLVDSGWPGDLERLLTSIERLGRHPRDIAAILLTHAHVDHVGGVNPLWARHGVPVLMDPREIAHARGEVHEQAGPLDLVPQSWRLRTMRWSFAGVRVGALKHPVAEHAAGWPSAATREGGRRYLVSDLPGHPTPVPCPGHTSGHAAYLFAEAGVLATGDALVTGHALSPHTGPQLLPGVFSHDPAEADDALDVLAGIDADTLAPGHGEVWRGTMHDAVVHARSL